ncbi:hypothetical protein ACQCVK_05095 [Rossellomorea vietnamensis]|uniref:hypothetical protein n=1 Tax=Rossellomorea vietnamensis TaxID=218284 RepID=UPI003CEA9A4F
MYFNNPLIEAVRRQQRAIERITRSMNQVNLIHARLVEPYIKARKMMETIIKTIDEFEELLSELNYPPIPNMYGSDMRYIIEKLNELEATEEKVRLLDEYIILRFNTEKVDQRIRIWNGYSWLENRNVVLEQIAEAHKQGLYFLSVLAVFPQVEGMLAELFPDKRNDKGEFTTKHLKQSFKEILEVQCDKSDQQWDKFYRENLLKGFTHDDPIDYLSRHALAHGKSFEYGTEVNSIKSFIILDYIINKINNYREGSS